MEKFKIEIFKRENPGDEFPWYRTLTKSQMSDIRLRLAEVLRVPARPKIGVLCALHERSHSIGKIVFENDEFAMLEIFKKLNISPKENVCINWYRFDNINEMKFDDFCKYFDYIYYPGPDDIDIFDSTLSWIVSVDHSEYISYLKFDL